MINPNVTNEYGKLDKVFMCKPFMGLPEAAAQLAFGPDERIPRLINGYEEFEKTLQDNGTEIIYARPLPTVQGQMYTRDRSAVIGDKMLVCPTGRSKEEDYWSAADSLLGRLSLKDIVFPNAIIHGGDIIVHNDTVFVGQGGIGTAREGLEIIKKTLAKSSTLSR